MSTTHNLQGRKQWPTKKVKLLFYCKRRMSTKSGTIFCLSLSFPVKIVTFICFIFSKIRPFCLISELWHIFGCFIHVGTVFLHSLSSFVDMVFGYWTKWPRGKHLIFQNECFRHSFATLFDFRQQIAFLCVTCGSVLV